MSWYTCPMYGLERFDGKKAIYWIQSEGMVYLHTIITKMSFGKAVPGKIDVTAFNGVEEAKITVEIVERMPLNLDDPESYIAGAFSCYHSEAAEDDECAEWLLGYSDQYAAEQARAAQGVEMSITDSQLAGLKKLREPFADNQISKLPKPTRSQTNEVKNNFKTGVRCEVCGGWHHPKVIHLDYVGHAAVTDRLLTVDPLWNWEPVATADDGRPVLDSVGGLWIRLTVCGVSRLGYGHPDGKNGGDAIKESIGDALRNAAMRFGCALDLWHKGDLHVNDDNETAIVANQTPTVQDVQKALDDLNHTLVKQLVGQWSQDVLNENYLKFNAADQAKINGAMGWK